MNDKRNVSDAPEERIREFAPRFFLEGWALYEGGDSYTLVLNGREIQVEKRGLDFIGVKPDAPQWAHDEYEAWIS